jgi:hypothetical protein
MYFPSRSISKHPGLQNYASRLEDKNPGALRIANGKEQSAKSAEQRAKGKAGLNLHAFTLYEAIC